MEQATASSAGSQLPNNDTANILPEADRQQELTPESNRIHQPPRASQRRRIKQYASPISWHCSNLLSNTHGLAVFCLFIFRYAVSTQWERQQSEGRNTRDIHSYCCCCAKRIGNMFALISRPDGTPVVIAGPCWPFCLFITFPLIIGMSMLVIFFLILGDTFVLVRGPQMNTLITFHPFPAKTLCLWKLKAQLDSWSLHPGRCRCHYLSFLCLVSRPWAHGTSHCKYRSFLGRIAHQYISLI